MIITTEVWDKDTSINGRDSGFLSEHFIRQNGSDERVLILFDGVVSRIEYLSEDFFNASDKDYMEGLTSDGMEYNHAIAETWGEKVRKKVRQDEEDNTEEAAQNDQLRADLLYLSIMTGVEL